MSEHPLADRIRRREARIGVIGLGYVGLPLAVAFANSGLNVTGFDRDGTKIERLRRGESYIGTVSSDAIRTHNGKLFAATDRWEQLGNMDCLVLCLPTPLTESLDPDLSAITATTRLIADSLRVGQLIVLESTTYPTTTRTVVLPILESRGLRAGNDYFLAYSPEREDPGHRDRSVANTPKVVGGYDPISAECAAALYETVAPAVVRVSSLEIAEAAKILENTYRAVNIALVNELKLLYDRMGIDIWEVIAAASTKPFGFQAFYPGPGLGGHCIPIDPLYLTWIARQYDFRTRFIELAGDVNRSMPMFVVGKIAEALNERSQAVRGSRIVLIGMAYKRDVDDPRESPGFAIWHELELRGAVLSYHDPFIPILPRVRNYDFGHPKSVELTADSLQQQDCVVIVTDHSGIDYSQILKYARLIVDTRNAIPVADAGSARIIRA